MTTRQPRGGASNAVTARRDHPVFDALIAEAKRTPPEDVITSEQLDRERPLTPEEVAAADAWLDDLEHEDAAPDSGAQEGRP